MAGAIEVYPFEEITVQPFQWDYRENLEGNRYQGELQAWCLDRDSAPTLIRVRGYLLTAYLSLPEQWEPTDETLSVPIGAISWNKEKIEKVYGRLVELLDGKNNVRATSLKGNYCGPDGWDESDLQKRPLYYADGPRLFVKLFFRSQSALDHTRFRANKPFYPGFGNPRFSRIKCQIWEGDISPMQKYTSELNIAPSQWFNAKAIPVPLEKKISTLEKEFVIMGTNDVKGISDDETMQWETFPDILSFDIETYSANHKAFSNKYNSTDICFMISCIFQRAKHPETRKFYLIIVGDCPPVKDTEIIKVGDELGLIYSFCDLIKRLNPTVIVSYNGFGFDYPYLDARYYSAVNRGEAGEEWFECGRLKNHLPKMAKIEWKSGAFGQVNLKYLNLPGILNVDMYCVVKRERKLRKYTLDFVSKDILGEGKHDVKAIEMNQIVQAFIKLHPPGILHVDIDNTATITLPSATRIDENNEAEMDGNDSDDGDEDNEGILEATETERHINEVHDEQAEHTCSAADELKKHQRTLDLSTPDKILAEVSRFCEYCLQDAILTVGLFEKMLRWTAFHELSNAFRINIVDTYTRGQQLGFLSRIYYFASHNGVVITQRNTPIVKFKGGLVQTPIVGYTEDVFCLDFKSMYPNIMKERNIDFTTLIRPEMTPQVPTGDTENYKEVVIDLPDGNKKVFHFSRKFKGLIPMICADLIDRRNATRAILKKAKEPFIKELLDSRQLALKIAANSMFGVLGATGKYSIVEAAMSITSFGQTLIKRVADFVCGGGKAILIYGDTDSIMVKFNTPLKGMELQKHAERVTSDINKMLAGSEEHCALEVELEKGMNIFCLTAKRYAARLLKDGKPIPGEKGLLIRGIVLARRDNCQWQSDLYRALLIHIIDGVGDEESKFQEAIEMIDNALRELYQGKVPWDKLLIAREMKSGYKSASAMMKVFSEESKKSGKPIQVGDRIEYLFVVPKDNPSEKAAGRRMRLAEAYTEALDEGTAEKIDYDRYAFNILKNGIEQLFSIGFKNVLEKLDAKYIQLDYLRALQFVLEEIEIRKYTTGAGKAKRETIIESMWQYEYLRPRLQYFRDNEVVMKKEVLERYLIPSIVRRSVLPKLLNDNPRLTPMMVYKTIVPNLPLVKPEDLRSGTFRYITRRLKGIHKSRIDGYIVELYGTLYSTFNDVKDEIRKGKVLNHCETLVRSIKEYVDGFKSVGMEVDMTDVIGTFYRNVRILGEEIRKGIVLKHI